jgi:hypothetical protein
VGGHPACARAHAGRDSLCGTRAHSHSSAQAEARLDGIYTQIERGDADANICFGFVGAAMQLAQKGRHREKLLRQALDAAMGGVHAASLTPNDRKLFRVMELSLREMLVGRKPTTEILYRCGLGILATATQQADPMVIVRSRMTSFRRFDAAA